MTHPMLASFLSRAGSLTYPVLASLLSGEYLLHIPCWLYFSVGSFSYTSQAGFFFFFFFFFFFQSGEFVLYIPCWLNFYVGSFSYTSPAALSFSYTPHGVLIFMQGVSLTHPVLASFFSFLLFYLFFYLGIFSYTSRAGFLFVSGEFLLHIPFWLHFYLGSL